MKLNGILAALTTPFDESGELAVDRTHGFRVFRACFDRDSQARREAHDLK